MVELAVPVEQKDGKLRLEKMKLGEPDASGTPLRTGRDRRIL